MDIQHQIPIEELYSQLDSGFRGLSDSEASKRLDEFGLNELRVRQQIPGYIKFLFQFKNFFAVLLMVGGALAMGRVIGNNRSII